MKKFVNKYGNYALITGASSGIGAEFARQLARLGLDLVLVARRKSALDKLASDLEKQHGIKAKTVELDLLDDHAVEKLLAATNDLNIGLLVLSAGMEVHGAFVENSYDKESELVKLNALIPMQLAHVFGGRMIARKQGGILFVSSTFGHQAVPYFANYAASKAYILGLGQALNYELKKSNVDVTVLSPGLTTTEMTQNMQGIDFKKMPITEMRVEPVVKKAIRALGKQQVVIPGGRNIFMDVMGKYTTPRAVLTNMYGFLVNRAMKAAAVKQVPLANKTR
ncbi:MAG: SDR family NAD(P)-dependent oxidoreductase [Gammaproteobacteria bacterium]